MFFSVFSSYVKYEDFLLCYILVCIIVYILYKSYLGGGGGVPEGGRTNERPGTDHVISGPLRASKKTTLDGAVRQTNRRTLLLYD